MNKLGILFLILIYLSLGIKCQAQSQFSDTLTRMEKTLFGMDYAAQSDDARLKRIEEAVYGSSSTSTAQLRISKLSKDLSADLLGQEIKPKYDTFADDDEGYKEPIPKADSNINYPSVDNLEKSVFHKEFKTKDICLRLADLERNVFKKVYNDDLNTRVERLQQAVMPERIASSSGDDYESESESYSSADSFNMYKKNSMMDTTSQFQDNGYETDDIPNLAQGPTGFGTKIPSYNEHNSVLDDYPINSDIEIQLGALEKKVLKKSFPNDTSSNRLLRMELKIFNTAFTDDDEQTRFDRIASAYQAKKSASRYDNNKFSQHAAAAMQVGAILLMIIAAIL